MSSGSSVKAGAKLRRSRHVSFFRKKDEIYAYHDLWGYILQMDRNVYEFIEAFGPDDGRPVAHVARAFRGRLRPEEIEGFVGTFRQQRCLVAPRADEVDEAFTSGYPSRAPWIVAWSPRPDEVVLSYKDRALGRIVVERLDRLGARFFNLADGERTIAELAAALAPEFPAIEVGPELRRLAFRFTHSDRQLLKLTDRPLYEYLAFPPPYLRSTMPYPRLEPVPVPVPVPDASPDVVDLARFHRVEIRDAAAQFDVEETTLSHMFREPHEALGGKSYGEAFAEALFERGLIPGAGGEQEQEQGKEQGKGQGNGRGNGRGDGRGNGNGRGERQVVEIGGGVGFFALRFLKAVAARDREAFERIRYAILDLSPVLQASQRLLTSELAAKIRHALANASRPLPLRDASVDLVISNEVIADLETVRLQRSKVRETATLDLPPAAARERPRTPAPGEETIRAARALVNRYGLPIDDAPEVFWLNFGALRLVEELARVLRPGGAAVLVEFGGESRYPVESTHLAHSEFSIHFGHLRHVAERLGFEVELTGVTELLGLRGDVRVLATTRSYFECLRALLDRRGISLQKLAYTEDAFAELLAGRLDARGLHGIAFRPVRDRALGLHPPEFLVAILRKPR